MLPTAKRVPFGVSVGSEACSAITIVKRRDLGEDPWSSWGHPWSWTTSISPPLVSIGPVPPRILLGGMDRGLLSGYHRTVPLLAARLAVVGAQRESRPVFIRKPRAT